MGDFLIGFINLILGAAFFGSLLWFVFTKIMDIEVKYIHVLIGTFVILVIAVLARGLL